MASRDAPVGPVRIGHVPVPRADSGVWSAISLVARPLGCCPESLCDGSLLSRWHSVHVQLLHGWIGRLPVVLRHHARAATLVWNGGCPGPDLLGSGGGPGRFVLPDGEDGLLVAGGRKWSGLGTSRRLRSAGRVGKPWRLLWLCRQ